MEYNKEQLEAISHGDGPMMVLAGPGSGKTAVIAGRLQKLVEEDKVKPEKILVVTFSKAASVSMRERFESLTNGCRYHVRFGTFHGIFFRILSQVFRLDSNNIASTKLKRRFLEEAIGDTEYDLEEKEDFMLDLEREIGKVKSDGIDIQHYYSASCPENVFREIYEGYEERLHKHRLIDFEDMIGKTYELFQNRPDILKQWQQEFQYILIDEFQDINFLQYEVVKMLAKPENNLFVVGDDDQSIYGFRGAKPDIMLRFPKEFKGTKKILLSTNYRSSQEITSTASKLIAKNNKRFDKKILSNQGKSGQGVHLKRYKNLTDESYGILKQINEYASKGEEYDQMAVLFRTNMQARTIVSRLMEQNIPFVMKERMPDLFEHFISKDIAAYFQLALGNRERKYFLRIANRPKRYIHRDAFSTSNVDFHQLYSYYHEKPWMEERLDQFQQDLIELKYLPPLAALDYIRKVIGYDEYVEEYSQFRGIKADELFDVLDDLAETMRDVSDYESWFSYIEEYKEKLQQVDVREDNHKGVQIMTMHGAKGLEFDTVFIPDVNEGVAPYRKAILQDDIEEERRMFYVAMTRARKYLHLSYVDERYNKESEPSRFLNEIQE